MSLIAPARARCLRLLGVLVVVFTIGATSAHATVTAAGSGEPAFTKGTSNTWFFTWNAPPTGITTYYLCYTLSTNGAAGSPTCTESLLSAGRSGTASVARNGLASGSHYDICATEYYDSAGLPAMPHMSTCSGTRMDTSTPGIAVNIDGTADYTNDPVLHLHVDYSDSISYPWPSTFDCIQQGSACNPVAYDAACSHPNSYSGIVAGTVYGRNNFVRLPA